jgi:transposase
MDHDVKAFRAAAALENRGRRGLQRRYSPTLRAQAVRYWDARRQGGEALRDVAVTLGVAPWSLYRWTHRAPAPVRFTPVRVAAAPSPDPRLVVFLDTRGPRVEGLDIETAARLLALLR